MKKLLWLFLLCGCDTTTERILFTKYDPIYSQLQTYAQSECVNDASFFSLFDTYGEFSSAPYEVGDIYKISQDTGPEAEIYVKIEAINTNDVKLVFNSKDDKYKKVVFWEETDHDSLGDFLKTAICNPKYVDYFGSISGKDSAALTYQWFKETIEIADSDDDDSIADEYEKRYDKHTVNINFPSIFYFYNAVKERKYDNDGSDDENDEQTKTSTITIEEVTGTEECDEDGVDDNTYCKDFSTITTPVCTVTVDDDAYDLREHDSTVISYPDAGCEILGSTDL